MDLDKSPKEIPVACISRQRGQRGRGILRPICVSVCAREREKMREMTSERKARNEGWSAATTTAAVDAIASRTFLVRRRPRHPSLSPARAPLHTVFRNVDNQSCWTTSVADDRKRVGDGMMPVFVVIPDR
ncbi:hypothetical protein GWI33_003297 [Rhynchophorus ferrugineus]|uniref:Uncharacterized protein n=1 Tax=Rhynchophorus ferrugineus TaxID=354439 RepID=A0A834IR12_RHYFE|nr:hypothetical protein GWI33_003297 [Rhynchophorus ferrugineus]